LSSPSTGARSSPGAAWFVALAALVLAGASRAQTVALPNVTLRPVEVVNLWPGVAPGETGKIGPERIVPARPRPFDQITDVTAPTLSVFQPAVEKRTGTGVLLIPGGGLERLAIEHEGYETAEWLTQHGITAFLLKYRVPARDPAQPWKVGLQDAQRAMGLIRANATKWQVDADAIGSIGFSAGAELNVRLSAYYAEPRQYAPVDGADTLSTRPDFNIAIYGGGLTDPTATTLRDDIASRLNKNTPPMFIAHAFDDQALNSVVLMAALKRANVASELHIFAAGGHGFGLRDTGLPLGEWRGLSLNWLKWQGLLDAPSVRKYARDYLAALNHGSASLPRFSAAIPSAESATAYAAQHRLVRQTLAAGGEIVGYKGALTSTSVQTAMGVNQPSHGVLFKAGRIEASAASVTPIMLDPKRPLFIETEIGYVIAVDIGTKLRVPRQAVTSIEALVPVIELPFNVATLMGGQLTANDGVAANFGSSRYILGAAVAPAAVADLDALNVSLERDGALLHKSTGADVKSGQAANLMTLINQIVDQGHVIHRGDVIICGALGGAKPAEKGRYTATFGPLGSITFEVR
jgi:2-keto-4-pentenoate hydratase/dienelactone hydrolase